MGHIEKVQRVVAGWAVENNPKTMRRQDACGRRACILCDGVCGGAKVEACTIK